MNSCHQPFSVDVFDYSMLRIGNHVLYQTVKHCQFCGHAFFFPPAINFFLKSYEATSNFEKRVTH